MHNRVPPDRTGRLICGWTEDAARNNRAFLLSVDPLGLAGDLGYAVTLTLAQTPATSAEWAAFIHRFLVTMRRAGVVRYHWVTEWTRQGRPHLHATLFWVGRDPVQCFADVYDPGDALAHLRRGRSTCAAWEADAGAGFISGRIVGPRGRQAGITKTPTSEFYTDEVHADAIFQGWVRATGQFLSPYAQHIERIRNMGGWSAYTAKHAARGVQHYQRQTTTLPEGWASSGRLWARGGTWPKRDDRYAVDDVTAWRMRRGVRRWLRASVKVKLARLTGGSERVRSARRQLRRELRFVTGHRSRPAEYGGSHRAWSAVAGLTSFLAPGVQDAIWTWAIDHPGAEIVDLDTGEVLRSRPGELKAVNHD